MNTDPSFYFPAPVKQKYCTQCASPLTRVRPPLDNKERDCCLQCGAIHYRNPLPVVGTLPLYHDKVLLCQRAIEPAYGLWTLPAGFMEREESTQQGAQRETMEEAGANVQIERLFTIIDVPYVSQIHFYYLATLLDTNFHAGEETLALKLFTFEEIPWHLIAFSTVTETLRRYQHDRKTGNIDTHYFSL